MIDFSRLTKDLFRTRKFSNARLRTFAEDHIQRMQRNNAGGVYDGLINATQLAYTAYYGDMVGEKTVMAQKDGLRISMRNARREVLGRLRAQHSLIAYLHGKQGEAIEACFPATRLAFVRARLDDLPAMLQRYLTVLPAYLPAEYAQEVTDITALANAFVTARSAQRGAAGRTANKRTDRRSARKALTTQLTRNLLIIASDHVDQADRFDDFFDRTLLPKR